MKQRIVAGLLVTTAVFAASANEIHAEGRGMSYYVWFDTEPAYRWNTEWVYVNSRTTYQSSRLLYGWYLHENRVRDYYRFCSGSTWLHEGAHGQVTRTGQRSECTRWNGCAAADVCEECRGERDPNRYYGWVVSAVVFHDLFKSDIFDYSWEWPRDSNSWCYDYSPVIVDLDGRDIALSEPTVWFDLTNDGSTEQLSWTIANTGDGFLALDRNSNGRIDNGSELFGNFTPLVSGEEAEHGFEALAEFDLAANGGNGDGFITNEDAVFKHLLLWVDVNQDGISDSNELASISTRGVVSIDLNFVENNRRDRHGNQFRYTSKIFVDDGRKLIPRRASDVFLVRGD